MANGLTIFKVYFSIAKLLKKKRLIHVILLWYGMAIIKNAVNSTHNSFTGKQKNLLILCLLRRNCQKDIKLQNETDIWFIILKHHGHCRKYWD